MATDVKALLENIESFYDFRDKAVVHVGPGAGELIGYGRSARSVVAVDADPEAVRRLGVALREQDLLGRVILFRGDLGAVRVRGDVVFFDFCLHEMADPDGALRHARTLAPEVLVADAAPASRWAWYLGDEARVEHAWEIAGRFSIARDRTFMGAEQFHDYAELLARVRTRGEPTLGRIEEFKGREGLAIQMPYRVALIR